MKPDARITLLVCFNLPLNPWTVWGLLCAMDTTPSGARMIRSLLPPVPFGTSRE